MLFDPLPAVRAAVASGICSICEKYWELLPGEVIKDLIGSVVNDLAYDSSSPDVRAAVFRVSFTPVCSVCVCVHVCVCVCVYLCVFKSVCVL